jgi:hypothetical protein
VLPFNFWQKRREYSATGLSHSAKGIIPYAERVKPAADLGASYRR